MRDLTLRDMFHHYSAELVRFLTRRVACRETAADLTQETFLRLLLFSGPSASAQGRDSLIRNGRAYLYRTAANLATDHQRRQRILPFVGDGDTALLEFVDDTPSAERVVQSRQQLKIIQTALHQLPVEVQRVFILARLQGLSYEQIGKKLGISPKTAFSRMVKALTYLKLYLDQKNNL